MSELQKWRWSQLSMVMTQTDMPGRAYHLREDVDAARLADKQRISELQQALQAIAKMTDADDPESYRCDDREGCLDTVFSRATSALATPPAREE